MTWRRRPAVSVAAPVNVRLLVPKKLTVPSTSTGLLTVCAAVSAMMAPCKESKPPLPKALFDP